ncbi:uncharacterized protein TNCV_4100411 [Trichonephila clavipes]|nr:uncharacterized protein TNCV_4100411 [Trichonephila clavipes]
MPIQRDKPSHLGEKTEDMPTQRDKPSHLGEKTEDMPTQRDKPSHLGVKTTIGVTVDCMSLTHQRDTRQGKTPSEGSRHEGSGQYDKARETRTTKSGTNRAAERRLVRFKQATAVKPCPYYLRSRAKQPEGIPEERRSFGIDSIPQNNIKRRSRSI